MFVITGLAPSGEEAGAKSGFSRQNKYFLAFTDKKNRPRGRMARRNAPERAGDEVIAVTRLSGDKVMRL